MMMQKVKKICRYHLRYYSKVADDNILKKFPCCCKLFMQQVFAGLRTHAHTAMRGMFACVFVTHQQQCFCSSISHACS